MALTTFSPSTLAKSSEINANFTYLQSLITQLFPPGAITPYGGKTAPTGFLLCDGSAQSRVSFAALYAAINPNVGTCTMTIAAPAVVTLNAHGLYTGDSIFLTTTGALPTGLSVNTLYYVVKVDANTFNLATSRANAYAGTKITTTGTQSGVHTLWFCPYGLGDGSSTFNIPDARGRSLAGADSMGGTAASRLTNPSTTTGGVYGNQGAAGGEQAHVLLTAELAAHNHDFAGHAGARFYGPDFNSGTASGAGGATWGAALLANTGSDTAHNTVSPTLVVNAIIKT